MNVVTAFIFMIDIVLATINDTIPEVTHTARAFKDQSGVAGQSSNKLEDIRVDKRVFKFKDRACWCCLS